MNASTQTRQSSPNPPHDAFSSRFDIKSSTPFVPTMTETHSDTFSNGNSLSQPHEEHQYLDLIRNILKNGEHRPDRYFERFEKFEMQSMLTPAKNRDRHTVSLRTASPPLLSFATLPRSLIPPDPGPTTPNNQTCLPPRRHRRTPLVHRRLHLVPPPLGSRYQDLGRQRQPRIPR